MRVCAYKSEKVMAKWPPEYWEELSRKLSERGHTLFAITDETGPEEAGRIIADCDVYVGPLGAFYEQAAGKRRVGLLGPTLKGDGVQSTTLCAGCIDKIQPTPVDCHFKDELCFWEITPNDVLANLC
jgi:hypothetical protein